MRPSARRRKHAPTVETRFPVGDGVDDVVVDLRQRGVHGPERVEGLRSVEVAAWRVVDVVLGEQRP
jgi:hypothetical protein